MINIGTFKALRDYVKGKISAGELESVEKVFADVREKPKRGESIIEVEFQNSEDFLKRLGMNGDDIWIYQEVTSPYSEYDFFDRYTTMNDFMEGYGFYHSLDEENTELLSQISKAILPMKFDLDDNKFRIQLSEKLMENFSRETQNILDDFSAERNYQVRNSLRKAVEEDMDEFFSRLDFQANDRGFKTTVADLLMLYMEHNAIHLNLKDLLEKVYTERGDAPGGWSENWYDYTDDDEFDTVSFNRYANGQLNQMLETIEEEGEEDGVVFEDFVALTDRITKKFEQGKYYFLPKDSKKETRFKIEGFEYPSMKITVTLQKGLKQTTIKLSEENFYHLLFQPSLFNLDAI